MHMIVRIARRFWMRQGAIPVSYTHLDVYKRQFVHSMVDYPLQKPVLDLWMFALLGTLAAETGRSSQPPERDLF